MKTKRISHLLFKDNFRIEKFMEVQEETMEVEEEIALKCEVQSNKIKVFREKKWEVLLSSMYK